MSPRRIVQMKHQEVPAASAHPLALSAFGRLLGNALRAWLILVFAVCAMLSAHAAAGTTFYVATDGNDSWNGLSPTYTSGNNGPFASLAKAQIAVEALAGT